MHRSDKVIYAFIPSKGVKMRPSRHVIRAVVLREALMNLHIKKPVLRNDLFAFSCEIPLLTNFTVENIKTGKGCLFFGGMFNSTQKQARMYDNNEFRRTYQNFKTLIDPAVDDLFDECSLIISNAQYNCLVKNFKLDVTDISRSDSEADLMTLSAQS